MAPPDPGLQPAGLIALVLGLSIAGLGGLSIASPGSFAVILRELDSFLSLGHWASRVWGMVALALGIFLTVAVAPGRVLPDESPRAERAVR